MRFTTHIPTMVVLLLATGTIAQAQSTNSVRQDWKSTSFGETMFVEWACFNGVVEWLDGPGREGMGRQMGGASTTGGLHGMESDAAGNLFMCDMMTGMLRAWRRSDGRLLTLSGNGHMSAGRPPERQGPAYRLNLGSTVNMAVVGTPLDGQGSVYLSNGYDGILLRLFRNGQQDGIWWYEQVAGGGLKPHAHGVDALEARLGSNVRPVATPRGEIGFTTSSGMFYWLKERRLVQGYDKAKVTADLGGLDFKILGIDGKNNFVGFCSDPAVTTLAGEEGGRRPNTVISISPEGNIVHKLVTPNTIPWGVYPDRRREQWYIHAMDESGIHRFLPNQRSELLLFDGTWWKHVPKSWGGNTRHPNEVAWFAALPLQDGRMVGWNTHGCRPVYIGTWLNEEE